MQKYQEEIKIYPRSPYSHPQLTASCWPSLFFQLQLLPCMRTCYMPGLMSCADWQQLLQPQGVCPCHLFPWVYQRQSWPHILSFTLNATSEFCVLFFFPVLTMEPGASRRLGKCSTTQPHHQPVFLTSQVRSHYFSFIICTTSIYYFCLFTAFSFFLFTRLEALREQELFACQR